MAPLFQRRHRRARRALPCAPMIDDSTSALPHPTELLPHRAPFLMVDELLELDPAKRVRARWHLTGDEYFFAGHFPEAPTLPGVLMIEALAQAGACAPLADPKHAGKIPLFAGVDKVKFRRRVVPGETLDLEMEFGRIGTRGGRGSGRASVDGETACTAELFVVLAELDD